MLVQLKIPLKKKNN